MLYIWTIFDADATQSSTQSNTFWNLLFPKKDSNGKRTELSIERHSFFHRFFFIYFRSNHNKIQQNLYLTEYNTPIKI